MTAQELIAEANAICPNAFETALKLRWLNALEGRIATEIMLMAPAQVAELQLGLTDTPLVGLPYDDIYVYWLEAKINEAQGEYDKYAVASDLFNRAWSGFVCWFAQTYDPVQGSFEPGRMA